MPHASYLEVTAGSNRELGLALGRRFGESLRRELKERSGSLPGVAEVAAGRAYLTFTATAFPQYIQELEGYAEGAEVPFELLWARSLEDELWGMRAEKCTSVVTNRGKLIGHSEDWLPDSQDGLWILKKTIGGLTILELYYQHTLGGQAVSINSRGFVQLVNTLWPRDRQLGIPKNVIARWLSETADPVGDLEKLAKLRRSGGYSHTLVSREGKVWNVECTARNQLVTRPRLPYVHANHYLTELKVREAAEDLSSSQRRYAAAVTRAKEEMGRAEMEALLEDQSMGPINSIFNARTIGKVIIDLEQKIARIWLKREAEKGWIDYQLDFL